MKTVIIAILSIIRIGLLTHLSFTKEELSGISTIASYDLVKKSKFGNILSMNYNKIQLELIDMLFLFVLFQMNWWLGKDQNKMKDK